MASSKESMVKRHVFVFNPQDNGGESLVLRTEFVHNGDPVDDGKGIFTNQELTLHSYCNAASFQLSGASITPEILRKLANELESAGVQARAQIKQKIEEEALS